MKSNYDLQVDIGKEIFLEFDQEQIIRKFSLQADSEWVYLTYLNIPCRIDRKSGGVEEYMDNQWRVCREYSTVMTIYDLLCHHRGETAPVLSGKWCTAGTFILTGITQTEKFTGKCAKLFCGQADKLNKVCELTGGKIQPKMAGADLTYLFQVTDFFPVLLQFWDGDEEFPPKMLILWDENTDRFMHFETTFYLQGDLLERLKSCMELDV